MTGERKNNDSFSRGLRAAHWGQAPNVVQWATPQTTCDLARNVSHNHTTITLRQYTSIESIWTSGRLAGLLALLQCVAGSAYAQTWRAIPSTPGAAGTWHNLCPHRALRALGTCLAHVAGHSPSAAHFRRPSRTSTSLPSALVRRRLPSA